MRIIQIAHALSRYDAASRFTLNLDEMLRELGYATAIFAHKIDPQLEAAVPLRFMGDFDGTAADIVIYQMTTGTSFNNRVMKLPRPIVLFYHNITPAKYFFGNAWGSWFKCLRGRHDLKKIVRKAFFAWAASEYSCAELRQLGLKNARPLANIVDPAFLTGQPPVAAIEDAYRDGKTNILVVGRGVPHKKQDTAIKVLAEYKKLNPAARLVIAGNIKDSFAKKLRALTQELHLESDVIFTGSLSQPELCSWYRACSLVLSLSEHEGFCVPLVEGMVFDKPVFAYDTAASGETLGGGGVALPRPDPAEVAQTIFATLNDAAALQKLAAGRRSRLADFSRANIKVQLAEDIKEIINLYKTV